MKMQEMHEGCTRMWEVMHKKHEAWRRCMWDAGDDAQGMQEMMQEMMPEGCR